MRPLSHPVLRPAETPPPRCLTTPDPGAVWSCRRAQPSTAGAERCRGGSGGPKPSARIDRRTCGGVLGRYPSTMPTLVLGTPPPELEALLERRRQAGVDRLDEVWQGVRHMVPGPSIEHADISQQLAELLGPSARSAGLRPTMSEFNVGESEHDFRVPDGGLHRPGAAGVWHATAALVVEILFPDDETWQKLPFFAAHHVDEVLIVDPAEWTVTWLALRDGEYQPVERSGLLELAASELVQQINWP
jgi:Uma2 family endonuclease